MANKVFLTGRLTKDPEVYHSTNNSGSTTAKYTLAVDRKFKQNNQPSADFIRCVTFAKGAEFAEKYLRKGTKIIVSGRIQTGSYTNRDGQKVYTTDVVVEEHEFVESKTASQQNETVVANPPSFNGNDGFMDIPDGMDEELPFV